MLKEVNSKFIITLTASAIVFMILFFIASNKIYTKNEDLVFSKTFTLKNNLVDTINANNEYSSINSFIKLDSIYTDKLESVKILSTVKTETKNIELLLVISVEHNNKSIFWKSYKLQNQIIDTGKWQEIEQIVDLNNKTFEEQYILKTYFWNKSKSSFLIKDISIESYNELQYISDIILNKN